MDSLHKAATNTGDAICSLCRDNALVCTASNMRLHLKVGTSHMTRMVVFHPLITIFNRCTTLFHRIESYKHAKYEAWNSSAHLMVRERHTAAANNYVSSLFP